MKAQYPEITSPAKNDPRPDQSLKRGLSVVENGGASLINAVIFDLDNCLAAADEVGDALLEPMFAAVAGANNGTLSHQQLAHAFADCWRLPLDAVARKHGFSDEMLAAGWAAGKRIAVSNRMHGYGDLGVLAELDAHLFVVTSGFRTLQQSKIEALGLTNIADVYIDAIDEPGRQGKEGIFREILAQYRFKPEAVLVVGDRPDSEIEAGNRLGIPTAQILRPGVARGTNATHYIHGLGELRRIIGQ